MGQTFILALGVLLALALAVVYSLGVLLVEATSESTSKRPWKQKLINVKPVTRSTIDLDRFVLLFKYQIACITTLPSKEKTTLFELS